MYPNSAAAKCKRQLYGHGTLGAVVVALGDQAEGDTLALAVAARGGKLRLIDRVELADGRLVFLDPEQLPGDRVDRPLKT
jgi:hypothetical protein